MAAEENAGTSALLPRVEQLLTRIVDQADRQRFTGFFTSAAGSIEGLGDLDLSTPSDEDSGGTDGSLWDNLPAHVVDALARVTDFLEFVGTAFPVADEVDDIDIDIDLEPSADSEESAASDSGDELAKSLSAFSQNLAHELRQLRGGLETPAAGVDPWSILERLGEFRGRTRSGIGEMFFLAAREFAVVRKEDVVPFYKEDIDRSLALRRSLTTLRARINVHRTRLARLLDSDEPGALHACLGGFHEVFDAFVGSDAYRSLHVVDRRSCLDLRDELAVLLEQEAPPHRSVETATEGLTKFLDSLTLVNQRELLIAHDREAVANTKGHLAEVETAVAASDLEGARTGLGRAIRTAEPLLGREPTFDGLVRLLRAVNLDEFELDDVLALASLLGQQL